MTIRSLFPLLAAGIAFAAAPAAAQDEGGDKVNMVIVYGDDECPQSSEAEIVVCARQSEDERYRIPENLRFSDGPATQSWAQRVERLEMVGDFGTMSCTPVGAGGITGCTQEMIEAAYADKANASGVRFSQLIEAARQERLATIDEEAAEEQARVEQIEREYMERLERERAAPTPGEEVDPSLPPITTTDPNRVPPVEPAKDTPFDDDSQEPQPLGAQVPARDPDGR